MRAWRALPSFRGGCQLHTWLHRIATNVCLDALVGRRKRIPPLDFEAPSDAVTYRDETGGGPEGAAPLEAGYERRESVELAFIAALRHLPARQRSVLVLRDVLDFSAKEAADALATTVASVNGALLRARRAADERLPDERQHAALRTICDPHLRETAEHFADAFERGEIDDVLALLGGTRSVPLRKAS